MKSIVIRVERVVREFQRVLSNTGGPRTSKRRVMMHSTNSLFGRE